MGNQQPKKLGKVSKNQIEVAALKAKIHLELMRDRKHAEIIKGQKQLVAKIRNKSRNRAQEILIAQRVINSLKYAAVCNQLMADAISIKSQAAYISENINNNQKLQPWLTPIYNLLYGADRLGISSLNEVKGVLACLNDPLAVTKYVNPQVIAMMTPSPTPEQLNIYMLEMSQRNNLPLEEINMVGHRFTKDAKELPSVVPNELFLEISRRISEVIIDHSSHHHQQPGGGQGQNYNQPGLNQNVPNNYYNQGYYPSQGFNHNQTPNNNGFTNLPPPPPPNHSNTNSNTLPGYLKKQQPQIPSDNPYKGFSNIKQGPQFYQPSKFQGNNQTKPKQFNDYQNFQFKDLPKGNNQPIYPSFSQIDFTPSYQPIKPPPHNQHVQPPSYHQPINPNNQTKSPTLSQILRQFDSK